MGNVERVTGKLELVYDIDVFGKLGDWLIQEGLSRNRAIFTKEALKSFWVNRVVVGTSIQEAGVSVKNYGEGDHAVWLQILWPVGSNASSLLTSREQAGKMHQLGDYFTSGLGIALNPDPLVQLEFAAPGAISGSYEEHFLDLCKSRQRNPIGLLRIAD